MTARRTPYTVNEKGGPTCGRCGAKIAPGAAAVSVWNPDGLSWHEHAECSRSGADGASLGARLMNDIRAGKPPVNPDPTHAKRKVQGT